MLLLIQNFIYAFIYCNGCYTVFITAVFYRFLNLLITFLPDIELSLLPNNFPRDKYSVH